VEPVKVEVGFDRAVITPPVPLTIVHWPVPTEGELPASVVDIIPPVDEAFWSAPALAAVGFRLKVISTSSVETPHGLLDIVHRNAYVDPAVPLKVEVVLDELVIAPPAPLMMLQTPVPAAGELPANVIVVNPHVVDPVWSAPALAVEGFVLNFTSTSSKEEHEPFEIIQRKV
jgi:hypothetical protein